MPANIQSFFKASRWTLLSASIKAISSLLFNKLIALYLGPTGITLQAHIMNLFNAIITIPQEGTNKALIKFLSPEQNRYSSNNQYIFAGILINIGAFILLGTYLFINNETFFKLFSFGESPLLWGTVFLLSTLAYIFNTLFLSLLQSQQRFQTYAILNTLGNLFGLLAIALFITQGSYWMLLGLPLGLGIAIIPTAIFTRPILSAYFKSINWSIERSQEHFKNMAGFVLMALSVLLFEYITSFAMREYSIHYFDTDNTGLWQAPSTLSSYYTGAFSAVVIAVYYPQVSSLVAMPKQLNRYVKNIFLIILPVIMIGLGIVFLLKAQLLQLLFSEDFIRSQYLFKYQLLGDFFKLTAFLFGGLLLAQGKTNIYIILQAISALIYITTIPLLVDSNGLEAFPFAHFLRNIIYCSLLLIICWKVIFKRHENSL